MQELKRRILFYASCVQSIFVNLFVHTRLITEVIQCILIKFGTEALHYNLPSTFNSVSHWFNTMFALYETQIKHY
jgi:hypothetical protein